MSTRQFLFVNKDADSSSLTRSSSREQSSINSHVQRGRRHRRSVHSAGRRKVQLTKDDQPEKSQSGSSSSPTTSTSSDNSIPARQSGFNTFVLTPDGSHMLLSPTQSRSSHIRDRQSLDSLEPKIIERLRTARQTSEDLISFAENEVQGNDKSALGSMLRRASSPQDISQFAINSVDPFSMSSVKIEPEVHDLMQYYQQVYHPAVWHAETRASGKATYIFQTSAAEVLRNAMASDVDMYALLACMASRRQNVDRQPGQHTDEYLQKALSSTRRLLEKQSKSEVKTYEQILMIIFHLYAAEGYRENMQAAKIHLKGAKTIVDYMGGLSQLKDPQMRELLIIGDGHLSAIALEPCVFPCDFDPGSYYHAISSELQLTDLFDLSDFAPALRQPPRTTLIPTDIQHLVEETAECTWVLQHANKAPPEQSKHAMRWVGVRSLAIRHRLQALQLADPRLDAIRVSLMLWSLVTMTLLGLKRLGFAVAPKLRTILKLAKIRNFTWDGHNDILAWILALGSMCAIPGSSEEGWFARKLAEVALNADVMDESEQQDDQAVALDRLYHLHNRFFYHDAVQKPRLERLAGQLVTATRNSQKGSIG